MDTTTLDPIAPVESADPAPPPAVEESTSIADHQASYGPETSKARPETDADLETQRIERERDEQGRFKHRARSQQATAEDVPQINALTKELRTAEAELFKLKPDAANETPRMRALKRQIAAVKAELGQASAPAAPAQERRQPAPVAEPAKGETRPKPSEDEVGTKYQTYGEYVEDLDDWKDEQREAQREAKRIAETAKAQQEAQHQEIIDRHYDRMAAFARATPNFTTVAEPLMTRSLPGLLLKAIVTDDKGPEYVYHLAQHPEAVDELVLLTDGKPPEDAYVATVQRRLKALTGHAQVASTGSTAAARPTYIPPRPPNPVRTGPIKASDEPPDETASIAEHARYYGPKRR